jgi:hypothetical protein
MPVPPKILIGKFQIGNIYNMYPYSGGLKVSRRDYITNTLTFL